MKELFDLVAASPELQKRLMEILSRGEEEGREAVEAALLAFAEEQGFHVTMEKVTTFFEGMQASCELGEAELDMVAGGKLGTVLVSVLNTGWGREAVPAGAPASSEGRREQICEEDLNMVAGAYKVNRMV